MNQLVKNYIQKPGSFGINDMVGEEKRKFAIQLYETVIEKKEYLTSIIKPKLKNWDADRIALLDMILMQMGIAELLYFETIPPKVTINEYIDIAKEYSTQQSGQFINGILDNIHKELIAENKIHKIDYRQKHD
jgi:N utilization substance protein B